MSAAASIALCVVRLGGWACRRADALDAAGEPCEDVVHCANLLLLLGQLSVLGELIVLNGPSAAATVVWLRHVG